MPLPRSSPCRCRADRRQTPPDVAYEFLARSLCSQTMSDRLPAVCQMAYSRGWTWTTHHRRSAGITGGLARGESVWPPPRSRCSAPDPATTSDHAVDRSGIRRLEPPLEPRRTDPVLLAATYRRARRPGHHRRRMAPAALRLGSPPRLTRISWPTTGTTRSASSPPDNTPVPYPAAI
jgi:hypothetical protein